MASAIDADAEDTAEAEFNDAMSKPASCTPFFKEALESAQIQQSRYMK